MRTRVAVAAGLAAVVAAGGGASASTHKVKPVCNIVQGTTGDAPFDPTLGGLTAVNKAPDDPNGDILSAVGTATAAAPTMVASASNVLRREMNARMLPPQSDY